MNRVVSSTASGALVIGLLLCPSTTRAATKFHVTPTGSDAATGLTEQAAFRTIQKGADIAQPGDTVLVHAGVYRERVKPPRGGTGENARITYLADPAGSATITGLDIWEPAWIADGNLYRAAPAATMFTDSGYIDKGNPYMIAHAQTAGWCLGQVVVDGRDYTEAKSKSEANAAAGRWWANTTTGTIYINFGGAPAGKRVEIATRRGAFRPYLLGLGYITVQGFTIEYCANQTMDGFYDVNQWSRHQSGMIGTRSGHHWIIRNNTIRKAKTIGLSVGMGGFFAEPYYNFRSGTTYLYGTANAHIYIDNEMPQQPQTEPDMHTVGFNLITGNTFDSIGQAGIVGLVHFGNTIFGNRFGHIPSLDNVGSAECAAIKFHMSAGALIERNLFENVPNASWTVWLDAASLSNRVSRNVFLGKGPSTFSAIYIEITSGRSYVMNVIDNNLFLGCWAGVGGARSDGVAIYHNLFYNCEFAFSMGSSRDGCGATDRCGCGATLMRAYNNLLIDNNRNYGLAFKPGETDVASDFNILIPAGRYFQVVNQGTGNAAFCGGQEYTCAQIDSYQKSIGNPGAYWSGGETRWFLDDSNGPVGCVGDFTAWKAMMNPLDAHTVEGTRDAAASDRRSVTLDLSNDPAIGGTRIKGVGVDFKGAAIPATPKAGPFQDLGTASLTTAFWDDANLPRLPALPAAPSALTVRNLSATANRLAWTNNAADASYIAIKRRSGGGAWEFWGYVNTTQDTIVDDQLTNANTCEYQIAARNAAGLSQFLTTKGLTIVSGMTHAPALAPSVHLSIAGDRRIALSVDPIDGLLRVRLLTVGGSVVATINPRISGISTMHRRLTAGVYLVEVATVRTRIMKQFTVR